MYKLLINFNLNPLHLRRLMLQDSTEEEPSPSKHGRYEYRDGSGPSSGQPPPSYSAQRVSFISVMSYVPERTL